MMGILESQTESLLLLFEICQIYLNQSAHNDIPQLPPKVKSSPLVIFEDYLRFLMIFLKTGK